MEMLFIVVYVLIVLILLFIVVRAAAHFLARRVIPNKYEWLLVLSHIEWKRTLQIKKDMEKIKKTPRGGMLVYKDLGKLEEEEFIEKRLGTPRVIDGNTFETFEYRLTPNGSRKKLDVGSTKGRAKDLRLHTT